jgi:actinorhodin biosynthesis protein ActVIA
MSQAVSTKPVTGDLYAEVQTFYARQMRALDDLKLEEYAATFVEDGVVEHASRGEKAQGRAEMLAGMRAALPRYAGVVPRHWFDKLLITPVDDDTINVSYYTLVTRTDAQGTVTFEPTFIVEDVLVRQNGVLFTKSRVIFRDTPSNRS